MADIEEFRRQLLGIMGVPPEQHDTIIRNQQEIQRLRQAEREAVARNAQIFAEFYADTLEHLPEGLTFTVEAG